MFFLVSKMLCSFNLKGNSVRGQNNSKSELPYYLTSLKSLLYSTVTERKFWLSSKPWNVWRFVLYSGMSKCVLYYRVRSKCFQRVDACGCCPGRKMTLICIHKWLSNSSANKQLGSWKKGSNPFIFIKLIALMFPCEIQVSVYNYHFIIRDFCGGIMKTENYK